MEEDPQPLSSHEFINMDEIRSLQHEGLSSKNGKRVKKQHT